MNARSSYFLFCLLTIAAIQVLAQTKKSLAPTGSSAQSSAKAYVPLAWQWEQKAITQRHQEFLDHIKGARNISIPKAQEDFFWEIDWDARQMYCTKVAEALFSKPAKFKFPEPFYSKNRNKPSSVPTAREKKLYLDCATSSVASRSEERKKWVKEAKDYAAEINRIDPATDSANLVPPVAAVREFVGNGKNEFASETFSASRYGGGYFENYSVTLEKGDGKQCPKFASISGDAEIYDGHLVGGGRTNSAHSVLLQVGNEFIAATLGTYEVSKGDIPIFSEVFHRSPASGYLSLSPDGNAIDVSFEEDKSDMTHLFENINKNQTWGTKGQGFLLIKSARYNLSTTWAKTDPYKNGANPSHDHSRGLAQQMNEYEFACVINFDKPIPSTK